ncbi:glycoside hydrolase family 43 protein [Bacteroides uniformis]|jgi:xylan 1,4-beta-xylosidase|uniref:Glycoside hydrolase n=1 Tax=Bacteroides uniformis TaxID=820 RepID=A0A3E4R3D9_BACUN|nr:glycoside hydrolase 43 family protein [Bacteroides uniformis]RGL14158.1 glycoside hydrolase [Bacteroides uniformis]
MKRILSIFVTIYLVILTALGQQKSWTADNGNGTYTNPLFYDEFSDPDLIRVKDTFYLVGTTMHCNPGLVVLESKDLVNWDFCSYAFDRIDIDDPRFRLENGEEAYGQGIWAPCIRYHDGKFYIFSNINGIGMQVYVSSNPKGPWKHYNMGGAIHDLSVLFDQGKIFAVYGYDEVHCIEIKPDFSGYVEGSDRCLIPRGSAMGEGHHAYKINGKYYIISADYAPMGRMMCARADKLEGPYETRVISCRETMGTEHSTWVMNMPMDGSMPEADKWKMEIRKPNADNMGCATLHQGGIVQLENGDWWGFSMLDFLAVGRTTCLSPVTWVDGWPYFGLINNLGRSPRTWIKPDISAKVTPHAPYIRSDNFDAGKLLPIWQWNHLPDDKQWSLKRGKLRLNTMPAKDLYWAKNTLTQRGIGPVSIATVTLDASHLKEGDIAGLGLLNIPYEWVGVTVRNGKSILSYYDLGKDKTIESPLMKSEIYLRITGDFEHEWAQFSFSMDGVNFQNIGNKLVVPYQTKTFQGARYALFAFNQKERMGGYAEFDDFRVEEPLADRSRNIPLGKVGSFLNLSNHQRMQAHPRKMVYSVWKGGKEYNTTDCQFRVLDRGNGKVVLEAMNGTGYVTVTGLGLSGDLRLSPKETEDCLFMWQDMLHGQCMLMSLKTNRYVGLVPASGELYAADWAGTSASRLSGTVFQWEEAENMQETKNPKSIYPAS